MSKEKRIFLACILSQRFIEVIGKWEKRFATLPVRWLPLEQLHITLIPPWYEENVDEVIALLKEHAISLHPFTIQFETVTFGPDRKRLRLLWATGQSPEEFVELKSQLAKLLQNTEEKRKLLLHMTLARLQSGHILHESEKTFSQKVFWEDRINAFSVIESHLRPTGAVYEELAAIPLLPKL